MFGGYSMYHEVYHRNSQESCDDDDKHGDHTRATEQGEGVTVTAVGPGVPRYAACCEEDHEHPDVDD